ncbi:type III secretion protein [Pseudomonas yamanorum]|nr:type III secretion protein [Pseudomonas yamanorum]
MSDLICHWLSSDKQQITLCEGDDEITLKRQGDAVVLGAQLTSTRSDNTTLQNWLHLSAASLNHFQGALAQAPASGALWLIHCLRGEYSERHLLKCLEALLNQRDTWRAMAARLAKPTQKFTPTSLRSLPH